MGFSTQNWLFFDSGFFPNMYSNWVGSLILLFFKILRSSDSLVLIFFKYTELFCGYVILFFSNMRNWWFFDPDPAPRPHFNSVDQEMLNFSYPS